MCVIFHHPDRLEKGLVRGGPYPSGTARMPALWQAAQRALRLVQEHFSATLAVNDVGYVRAHGDMRTYLCALTPHHTRTATFSNG
jgi:hypothetical protein